MSQPGYLDEWFSMWKKKEICHKVHISVTYHILKKLRDQAILNIYYEKKMSMK